MTLLRVWTCRAAPLALSARVPGLPRPRQATLFPFQLGLQELRATVRLHREQADLRQQPHTSPACAAAAQQSLIASVSASLPLLNISPGEVHIWWLDPTRVVSAAALQQCSELLTPAELADCSASAEPQVQRERTLARALLRTVLARYLGPGVHPQALQFVRNGHGKPELLWPAVTQAGTRLRFNLTHTASMIGLAVAAGRVVGLDVEERGRRTRGSPLHLARRRFSPQEVADLESLAEPSAQAAYFLQLWTLKEAYVKALGCGLSAGPGTKSFSFRVQQRGQGDQWQQQGCSHSSSSSSSSSSVETLLHVDGLAASSTMSSTGDSGSSGGQTAELQGVISPARSSSGSSGSSSSSRGGSAAPSASISFAMSAAEEKQRWQFLLLQPTPGHVGALCIEQPAAYRSSDRSALRLSAFEASLPWEAQPADVAVVAEGAS